MLWEAIILAVCLTFGFGIAILMARRIKNSPPIQQIQTNTDIDVESLIARVAAAIGEQMSDKLKEALKDLPAGTVHYRQGEKPGDIEIQIDDRVIPMNVSAEAIESNLENMATEETQVDTGLENAKSKLASILKKKKEKE